MRVDNAIILAAGVGSRMLPLTAERPKSLLAVKGELLIERLVKQLLAKDIRNIIVVIGYKHEQFHFLAEKYGVHLLYNPHYHDRNTCYSLCLAAPYLKNSYIVSADYYFFDNPFREQEEHSYYCTVPPETPGGVLGVTSDASGKIIKASVPAEPGQWLMLGHGFFDEKFSRLFGEYLKQNCALPENCGHYWETIYRQHIRELDFYEKRCNPADFAELDTPEELEAFDSDWRRWNPWANL